MGITNVNPEELMSVAEAACAEGETIHNMPFTVTADMVYSAILDLLMHLERVINNISWLYF